MAGYLQVDIDVLARTVQSLRASEEVLGEAMNALTRSGHGDIGTPLLNATVENFERRWRFGIERIREAASATAEGVSKCHDAYVELDSTFADAIDQATGLLGESAPADEQGGDR